MSPVGRNIKNGVVRSTSDNRWLEPTTPSAPAQEAARHFADGRSHPSLAKEGNDIRLQSVGEQIIETDVAIVGGGNAALCAALTARESGASVVVFECAPIEYRGGNSRHTRNMRVSTATYPEDEYFEDLRRVTGGQTTEQLARIIIRESFPATQWMKAHGARFQSALGGTLHLDRTNAFFLGGGKALMNAHYAAALQRGIRVLYNAEVTRLEREKIEEVEIQHGSDKFSLNKVGSDWKLPDGRKLQWDKISAILNTLEFEKAKDIVDTPKALSSYGLDKPRAEVVFRQGSNELQRLAFGADSKNPEGVYARTSDSPAVKVVSKSVFDNFNLKAEDLVETPPPPAPQKPASEGTQKR